MEMHSSIRGDNINIMYGILTIEINKMLHQSY